MGQARTRRLGISFKNVIVENRSYTTAEMGRKSRETRPKDTAGMMSERVEIMRLRHEAGQDIWTGEPLEGGLDARP